MSLLELIEKFNTLLYGEGELTNEEFKELMKLKHKIIRRLVQERNWENV